MSSGIAKIEKPPRWIPVTLTVLLVGLIFIGFPFARYYDQNAKWSEPVTIECENAANVTPPNIANITIMIPAQRCWSAWLVAPRGATGIWIDNIPPNLAVYWGYDDGTTYKQEAGTSYPAIYKRVTAIKLYNTGNEPIMLPINFRE